MLIWRKILFPFSLLYGGVLAIRHFLYDKGVLRSVAHNIPVIGVGNLSFGGTGKTPMTEYLVRLLQNDHQLAVLSRGYKRATKGFFLADAQTSVRDIGDEPWQYYKKFPEIRVAVDANRNRGVHQLLQLLPSPEVIVLDDALQHRKIRPGLRILLTTYSEMYVDDLLFPAGNLRDIKRRSTAADIIIVTKCPATLSEKDREKLKNKITPKLHQQLFFTTLVYDDDVRSSEGTLPLKALEKTAFTLVTGIANPKPLLRFLEGKGLHFNHLKYPDHHEFSEKDMARLQQQQTIVTTEKDYARLQHQLPGAWYLPVRTAFLAKETAFNDLVKRYIKGDRDDVS